MKYEVRLNGERAVILDAHGASIVDIEASYDEDRGCNVLTPTFDPSVAENIARAVNAHDALVAALQNMVDADELTADDYGQARAALALARGGK